MSKESRKPRRAGKAGKVPSKGEMQILKVLWQVGPASVKLVHEKIGTGVAYTTILKQLQLMTEKGLVERDTEGRAHIYRAVASEQPATGAFFGDLVDRLFGGSASQLVMQALKHGQTSPEELAEIRRLLDEVEGAHSEKDGGAR